MADSSPLAPPSGNGGPAPTRAEAPRLVVHGAGAHAAAAGELREDELRERGRKGSGTVRARRGDWRVELRRVRAQNSLNATSGSAALVAYRLPRRSSGVARCGAESWRPPLGAAERLRGRRSARPMRVFSPRLSWIGVDERRGAARAAWHVLGVVGELEVALHQRREVVVRKVEESGSSSSSDRRAAADARRAVGRHDLPPGVVGVTGVMPTHELSLIGFQRGEVGHVLVTRLASGTKGTTVSRA